MSMLVIACPSTQAKNGISNFKPPLVISPNKYGIKILAVIFEDRTSDGDVNSIQEMRDYRAGVKLQRLHSLALLQNIQKLAASGIKFNLSEFETGGIALSKEEEKNFPQMLNWVSEQNETVSRECSVILKT